MNIVQLKQIRLDMEALRDDKTQMEVSFYLSRYICYNMAHATMLTFWLPLFIHS